MTLPPILAGLRPSARAVAAERTARVPDEPGLQAGLQGGSWDGRLQGGSAKPRIGDGSCNFTLTMFAPLYNKKLI